MNDVVPMVGVTREELNIMPTQEYNAELVVLAEKAYIVDDITHIATQLECKEYASVLFFDEDGTLLEEYCGYIEDSENYYAVTMGCVILPEVKTLLLYGMNMIMI